MGNALAIAAVSAVLKDLLNNGLVDAQLTDEVTVRVGPPPNLNGNGNGQNPGTQLNLFLYQVGTNPGWRNQGLPSRNSRGEVISSNPLALDLHYLLTAYGAVEFEAEVLLGYAMQLLHENAIFSRGEIRRSLATDSPVSGSILPPGYEVLSAAGLAEQLELIKITPSYLDTEEMSRLWSSLQSHYRTSTAYQVSVVLIESQETPRSAPPVLNRRVFALPVRSPFIESVTPQVAAVGELLTLRGYNLRSETTQVAFGNSAIAPISLPVGSNAFTNRAVTLPLPPGLSAGVNTVQVLHPLDLETPQEPHRGVDSNVAAFILRPNLVEAPPAGSGNPDLTVLGDDAARDVYLADIAPDQLSRTVTTPAIRLRVNLTVMGNQRISLLLNETPIPSDRPARAYAIADPALRIAEADLPASGDVAELAPPDQRSDTLVFAVPTVPTGTYLVRLRVDGAESPLTQADPPNPEDPVAPFTGPTVTL